ncbi:MAG: glycosyltransferase family 2 protein [Hyphomicrobiaceae bacterium]|nr:glycosyltransferase family 2 protein [Hyphomicrobiaceae bacterium]
MTDPVLSICIPTYNRADFLDYLLTDIAGSQFPFAIELVISDNASTDLTRQVVEKHAANGLPISYYRHDVNKGSVANYLSAHRRARGKFVMYAADDDLLIPGAVADAVGFLQNNPRVLAAYAPWTLYDDVAKKDLRDFYSVEQDIIFETNQIGEIFKFIVERHIFPEIVIFRAEAVRSLIMAGNFCFQFFVDFAHVFARGPVAFLAKPFYRSVTVTHLRHDVAQVGMEQVMTEWDSYRGGLEYFVYKCLVTAGLAASPAEEQSLRATIDAFVDGRMSVAQRLWLGRKDFVRAYEILCRRRFFNPAIVAEEAGKFGNLQQMVAFQTLARLANSIVDVQQVLLGDLPADGMVEPKLRECGLEPRIRVLAAPDMPSQDDLRSAIVLLQTEANRQKFLDQGYQSGLIVSQTDLTAVL